MPKKAILQGAMSEEAMPEEETMPKKAMPSPSREEACDLFNRKRRTPRLPRRPSSWGRVP